MTMEFPKQYPYDVVLSYAGEDRSYAETLAKALTERGIKVFYDQYEKPFLWGKDLYTHLSNLYQNQALYCVMFLSKHYASKVWTNHEREAAQARALHENREYILPIRLDNTEIPGILSTTAYLDWYQETVESIAVAIFEKLRIIKPDIPNLVFMAGLPGSGKTTLALALGRALKWQVVEKDLNKSTLMTIDIGVDEDRLAEIAYELAFAAVKDLLIRQKASVILDTAGLHSFLLDKAKEIAAEANAKLKVILCVADRDLRNHRLRNRSRQVAAIRVDPASIVDYLHIYAHLPADTLTLYTNAPLEACVAKAVEFLIER